MRIYIYATAFLCGILTLGLEILAGRLLAPFFGSSLHQWAALIGVILLAYVVGYELHRRLTRFGLVWLFAGAGLYVLSLPAWAPSVIPEMVQWPFALATVSGALILTAVPSVLWAAVLPTLQSEQGSKAARVLAFSTVGNLFGVWGVAFWAIPHLGTRATLYAIAGLSLLLSFGWAARSARTAWRIAVCAGLTLPFLFWNRAPASANWGRVALHRSDAREVRALTRETGYQKLIIWQGIVDDLLKTLLVLSGNPQFIWSPSERLTPGEHYEYYNFATAAAFWSKQGACTPPSEFRPRVLVLGVAGGLIPWQIRQFSPQAEITGYEIDPGLYRTSLEFLPLGQIKNPGPRVLLGDARYLLSQAPPQELYDLIVLDCFFHGFVPFHLTTAEFFVAARDHLHPDGVLITNFHTLLEETGLLDRLKATMMAVFPATADLNLRSGITMGLASRDSRISFADRFGEASLRAPSDLAHFHLEAVSRLEPKLLPHPRPDWVLTDDHNDTEQRLYGTRRYIVLPDLF